jgi:multiple sugar transport system permease protein
MTATQVEPPPASLGGKRQAKRTGSRHAAARRSWVLLLPAAIPVLVLSVYPLLRGAYLGFTDAKAGLHVTTSFTGVENFIRLWHNQLFLDSFRIGLVWAVSVTLLQTLLGLGLALLLNEDLRLRWLARTLSIVPWAMPPVIIAVMWRLLLDPTAGAINETIRRLGFGDGGLNLLGTFATALPTVIVIGVWVGMPQTTVVLLAGLQSVPGELYEAASIDGAGAWSRFRHITLPQLMPTMGAITSLNFIWNFNSFGLVYVLTAGGPGGQTMLPMLFAYKEAFGYGEFGYAAAMADVMVVVIVGLMLVFLRSRLRREV